MNIIPNTIIPGDALTILKDLPSLEANLVICSPPYFQQRDYTSLPEEMGKEATIEEYIDKLAQVFEQCVRITKADGHIVFNLGDKYLDGNLQLIPARFALEVIKRDKKVKLINQVTWVKKNPTPQNNNRKRLVNSTEPFFDFVKSKNYFYRLHHDDMIYETRPDSKVGQSYFRQIAESSLTDSEKEMARSELAMVIEEIKTGKIDGLRMKIRDKHAPPYGGQPGGRTDHLKGKGYTIIKTYGKKSRRDVLECPVESISNRQHPAIYPQSIVEFFINITTRPGDLVLDPFMGSGTTALACKNIGRHYLGIELCPIFVKLAEERVASMRFTEVKDDSDLTTQENDDLM